MTSTAIPSSRAVTSSPVVVALDYDNRDKALAFVDRIDPRDCRLKVGKEMFTLLGPQFVRDLHQRGFEVFLDLKFHDIPNTTARAVAAAAEQSYCTSKNHNWRNVTYEHRQHMLKTKWECFTDGHSTVKLVEIFY